MHLAELPSESELGEVDISRWLMTRRNVASYDCHSDVSAGLPGIAYVRPLTIFVGLPRISVLALPVSRKSYRYLPSQKATTTHQVQEREAFGSLLTWLYLEVLGCQVFRWCGESSGRTGS